RNACWSGTPNPKESREGGKHVFRVTVSCMRGRGVTGSLQPRGTSLLPSPSHGIVGRDGNAIVARRSRRVGPGRVGPGTPREPPVAKWQCQDSGREPLTIGSRGCHKILSLPRPRRSMYAFTRDRTARSLSATTGSWSAEAWLLEPA